MDNKNTGKLYIIPTPIGNIEDISYRAVKILKTVQLIASEDTRHTKKLLKKFNINTSTISFHKYNEIKKTNKIINLLNKISIALVSNAGTPTISDPGYTLIKTCHKKNIIVVPLPGPCALITALSASGIPSDQFYYQGFLPKKSNHCINILKKIKYTTKTIIFYESCYRIIKSITNIIQILGENRIIVLAKEITKKWETIKYDTAINILTWLKGKLERSKGEMVLIIKGIKKKPILISKIIQKTLYTLSKTLSLKMSIKFTSEIHQINKNTLYQYAIKNIINDKK